MKKEEGWTGSSRSSGQIEIMDSTQRMTTASKSPKFINAASGSMVSEAAYQGRVESGHQICWQHALGLPRIPTGCHPMSELRE